ncbi:MAG: aminotransferase class V-fold PLP-dependent enzyme [Alphaproteobacteria bacterium]
MRRAAPRAPSWKRRARRSPRLAGARADQVIFTSGATRSNNLAIFGAVEGSLEGEDLKKTRITRLFVSAIEHKCVMASARRLAERFPWVRLEILPVTADGVLDIEALCVALREGKGRALVAVMLANNEIGTIQPIAEVSALVREAGGLLLVDAVPAAGKMKLDFALCDYMVLSAHKLGGPLGAGALIVADGAPLVAQILGGAHQRGMRAGSGNLPGDAGFGAAPMR